ncbi:serine hydroxymethyltransferase [Rhizobiales bacterium]|uniref:DUF6898 family protein n=1 Tax=Hongsoonwoonella zoysiae TaxID=2821844 RepID=UPI001561665F|nr:serine hydroxymethyltransferase [Hongsoonwoonella zoysiae]NRG18407.1 serine hydroxymethyltransferase [Hongsoonwoonella zoysiae]
MVGRAGKPGEVFLEFAQIGRQMKVTAVDAQSGVEVVVFGPVSTPRKSLQDLAVRKLKRRMEQLGH